MDKFAESVTKNAFYIAPARALQEYPEPPDWIVELLEDRHPRVRIAFNSPSGRWGLYEFAKGLYHLIVLLGTAEGEYVHPSYGNTISWLDEHSRPAIMNRWDIARWLNSIDEPQRQHEAEVRRRNEPQIREGSNALYDRAIGKVQVPVR